ncbi:AbrB/MazE/SpoVT family DNA-binding domain-containing protein [Aneurinibacillus aneurinilyticus]|uniref:AbrB/MazE/SpoVT family DNA-binding domain-containing protein n=1 Tax=Aneurinibacillus aneurinilyticus TaxID=1391 RepID=UPI002E1EC94C|nr:AbrB/MazE/SpoVT family DNA-binding domain-containing protein [Aneurinibacillus aneurinilyticus]MED0722210.1 AbrB/MazE/SpoVT family DNA-binding domain-containing protein [Aneurinibacillus aneurinilyticus]
MEKTKAFLDNIREYREITLTSKRQITLPKSFCDRLDIEGRRFEAYLTDDGIYLRPVSSKNNSVYDEDVKGIIRQVMDEGYDGDEMVEEAAFRIGEYQKMMNRRIQEFENDLRGDSVSDETEETYNGLDIFFDTEAGETTKDLPEESSKFSN